MNKTKKIVVLSACVVAAVAIVVGLCCFFFSAKPVKYLPSFLKINVFEGEYHLEAEYGGEEYSYEFRLEQKFDDEYVLIATVKSKVNNIKLSDNLQVVAGQEYRFSARYTHESEKGKWSEFLEKKAPF